MDASPVLKSWKEISAFLRVTARTAQRWERDLGLPVHRTRGERGSAVLGFREEIETWLQSRPAGEKLLGHSVTDVPEQGQTGTSTYGGTLITDLLWKRPSRPADLSKEIEILRQMAPQIANQAPDDVLDNLVTHAMELCKADSAGVSLADVNDCRQPVFRWVAAAGKMKDYLGGTTPRNFSPCGICLERNAPQLFSHPERFFAYLQDLALPMTELLLIPFYVDHQSFGTLWVFSHHTQRKFDREDARILTSLADVAGATLRVMRLQEQKTQAEERSAADFQAMTRLYEVGNRCARPDSKFEECLDAIVATAIAITGADKGNLQLFNPTLGGLTIAAQCGFEEPFLKFFAVVRSDDSACSVAMQLAERVIVEDVTQSDVFAGKPSLDVLVTAGVRAVQSMPLMSSSGKALGMISTHFRQPQRPDERKLRFMDLLARQAADYVERKQSEETLRRRTEQFKILFDNAPFGVCLVDSDFRIREVNPVALPVFGDLPDLIGRDFSDVIHLLWRKEYADEIVRIFRRTLSTGESDEIPERAMEHRIDCQVTEHHRWRVDRIPLAEGGYGVVCRDILAIESQTKEASPTAPGP